MTLNPTQSIIGLNANTKMSITDLEIKGLLARIAEKDLTADTYKDRLEEAFLLGAYLQKYDNKILKFGKLTTYMLNENRSAVIEESGLTKSNPTPEEFIAKFEPWFLQRTLER